MQKNQAGYWSEIQQNRDVSRNIRCNDVRCSLLSARSGPGVDVEQRTQVALPSPRLIWKRVVGEFKNFCEGIAVLCPQREFREESSVPPLTVWLKGELTFAVPDVGSVEGCRNEI